MKVIELKIDNVMRIKAAHVRPNGKHVVPSGANEQGKTSILKSVEMAFVGKKAFPPEPVRKGAKNGQILLKTEDFTITSKIAKSGKAQVEIRTNDGAVVPSPAAFLEKVYGKLSFDPLRFASMKPKEQVEFLREIVPALDFTLLDQQRQEAYDKRTEINRECKRLQGALEKLPEAPEDTPGDEVSIAELSKELERRQKTNADNDRKRQLLNNLRADASLVLLEIEELEAKLKAANERLGSYKSQGTALKAEVDALEDQDLDELREQITNAENINKAVRTKRQALDLQADLETHIDESEQLTQAITDIDERKRAALEEAELPVEGLEIKEDGVYLGGLPFEQASQAQRIAASVAIGAAANPELRTMLVRDAALMDDKHMDLLLAMAEQHDMQLFIERVGCDKYTSIVIEDGAIVEDRTDAEPDSDGPQPAAGLG